MSDTNGRTTDRRSSDAESDASDADDGTDRPALDRRRLLTAGGAATTALLAGCAGLVPKGGPFSGDDDPEADTAAPDDGDDSDGAGGGENQSSSTPTAASTPAGETDVVGLVPKRDGDQYEFIVTLDAPAGAGGADWWQVETLDGTQLGRRELDSPRSDTQFTTSKPIAVEDEPAVVVRGHHTEVGYGGQAMLLDVESGTIDVADQGDERESFENYSF